MAVMSIIDGVEQPATAEAWEIVGHGLAQLRNQVEASGSRQMWAIGDWLVTGEDVVLRHLKKRRVRQEAARITGYSRHTLSMAASVARKIGPAMRIDELSWWHHLVASRLDREEVRPWLVRAANEGWSTREFRARLQACTAGHARPSTVTARWIARLVTLRRDQIDEELRSQLRSWWDREMASDHPVA